MATGLTAALVALVLAQGAPQVPVQPGERPGTAAGTETAPPAPTTPAEPTVQQGIPYIPSVVPTRAPSDGIHLDLGLLSEIRTRTLSADTGTVWGTDIEVTPGVALEIGTPTLVLALGYAPRLTVPLAVGEFELAVLNRATLRAEWRVDPLWTMSALGVFVVGDYSQLIPASTPGGAGPPPPALNPVRSFETYPYVGIDTLLRVDGILSPRTRLRLAGGYFDFGGTGPVGEANQPRAWGPQGEAALAWDPSPTSTLTTLATGQNWMMSGSENVFITTLVESWRQAWTSDLESSIGLGGGFANREVESRTAAGKVVPVARASLAYQSVARQPIRLALELALAPYFDTYARIPYQRFTLGASVDWRPSDEWRLIASFSGALAPYTVRAPESYGTAGLSASFSPAPFLVLTMGGFSLSQFQGETQGGGAFRQWTGYFSVALHDRLAL